MRWHRVMAMLAGVFLCAASQAAIQLERVATGASTLVYAQAIGNALYLVEQRGRVRLYDMQTNTTTNFLDLTGGSFSYGAGETGLLGIAFDPDYASNGIFYVNSTQRSNGKYDGRIYNEVARFRRSTGNPATADVASRQTVIEIPKSANQSNHNAGWIGFGNDRMLYITTGDGGGGGDPDNNAQNGQSPLGKVLRLDVSDPTITTYAIPADNPFANGNGGANAGFRDEIWATGLRNPFRAGFDRKTGDLYIGDVGQGTWEEIDRAPAGAGGLNFGWRLREGAHTFNNPGGATTGLTDPIHEYGHNDGRSVIGGTVFRGGGELDGWYLFSDFYNGGAIWGLPVDVDCQAANAGCPTAGQARIVDVTTTAGALNAISGFSTDDAGNLYISDYDGEVFRLAATPVPLPSAGWLLGTGLLLLARRRVP